MCLGADYTPNADDEVEDLYDLIVAARAEVPFDAVCSGAILSDYQGPDYHAWTSRKYRIYFNHPASLLSFLGLASGLAGGAELA